MIVQSGQKQDVLFLNVAMLFFYVFTSSESYALTSPQGEEHPSKSLLKGRHNSSGKDYSARFRIWIEEFFLREKVIVERREGEHYFYKKTERGELFHKLLKSGNLIKLFSSISGRKLRH